VHRLWWAENRSGRGADDAPREDLIVARGHSMAFGARFLKRFIDKHVKLPISARSKEGTHFDVRARHDAIVVEPSPAPLADATAVVA
jgi:ATP-dependent Clp protease ATP-binding subunit ClpA